MRTLLIMALLAASWAATGEELPDPTRPAVDLGGGQGGAATEAEMSAQRPKEGLQTIIIAPGHRLAVINGQTVPLGGSYAGAKLVEIREDSVVLQGAQGTKIMELFPKVNIRKNKSASQAGVSKPEDGTGTGEQPEAVGGKK